MSETNGAALNLKQRANAHEVSERLMVAFPWHLTPQGNAYWNEVFDHLRKLSLPPEPPKEERLKKAREAEIIARDQMNDANAAYERAVADRRRIEAEP